MVRGALSGVLISGIGGNVTFATPVVRTRFGTAGGALTDSIFFCNWTRCSSARSLGLGDFGPALKVSLRLAEYLETTQIAATPPKRRWNTMTAIRTGGEYRRSAGRVLGGFFGQASPFCEGDIKWNRAALARQFWSCSRGR